MSENRVDLGNVKGDTGLTGVGIANIIEMPPDEVNLKRIFRIYFTDTTNENPHYYEYQLTDTGFITRLNQMSEGTPSSDKLNVPTIYLLKQALAEKPSNTVVYRKEQVYTKTETDAKILEYLADIELFEVVSALPTGDDISENRIYLLQKNSDDTDSLNQNFDLYLYADNDWKKLDNLTFNINNYYNKTQTDNLLNTKQTANLSNDIVSDSLSTTKYPSVSAVKDYVDAVVTGGVSDYYTKTEIDNMISDIQDFIHS